MWDMNQTFVQDFTVLTNLSIFISTQQSCTDFVQFHLLHEILTAQSDLLNIYDN